MNPIFSNILELCTNFMNALIFYYLISHCLKLKYHSPQKYLCVLLFFSAISINNILAVPVTVSLINVLIVQIILAVVFASGSLSEKIFWGSVYSIIDLISENLVIFSIGTFSRITPSILLEQTITRYASILLYLAVTFIFVLIVTRIRTNAQMYPAYLLFSYLLIILLSILSVQNLLSTTIAIEKSNSVRLNLIDSLYYTGILFLVVIFLSFALIIYTGVLYKRNSILLEKDKEHQIEQEQWHILTETNNYLRTWRHENTNHLLTCHRLLDAGKNSACREYLSSLITEINDGPWSIYTGNSVIDSILSVKLITIKKLGIAFEHKIFLPPENFISVSKIDLSALLGNLLDNAMEACKNATLSDNPYISLTIKPAKSSLMIELTNSSNGQYCYDGQQCLITTKTENSQNHGLGIKRIKSIVTENGGFYDIQPQPDSFTITLILPLKNGV